MCKCTFRYIPAPRRRLCTWRTLSQVAPARLNAHRILVKTAAIARTGGVISPANANGRILDIHANII